MNADAHKTAAEELDRSIADLGDPATRPYNRRAIIELYWGASFEWLAYGTDHKHGKHKENHEGLVRFLRDVGEPVMADLWTALEGIRRGGFYGHRNDLNNVLEAQRLWQDVRTWAQS